MSIRTIFNSNGKISNRFLNDSTHPDKSLGLETYATKNSMQYTSNIFNTMTTIFENAGILEDSELHQLLNYQQINSFGIEKLNVKCQILFKNVVIQFKKQGTEDPDVPAGQFIPPNFLGLDAYLVWGAPPTTPNGDFQFYPLSSPIESDETLGARGMLSLIGARAPADGLPPNIYIYNGEITINDYIEWNNINPASYLYLFLRMDSLFFNGYTVFFTSGTTATPPNTLYNVQGELLTGKHHFTASQVGGISYSLSLNLAQ
jgi:hypothetical protein